MSTPTVETPVESVPVCFVVDSLPAPAVAPVQEVPEREHHPVASIFPMMSEADLNDLADDIRQHGLREPIWIYQGQVIDGRNRYAGCKIAGVEPRFREWDGNGSLTAFVMSLNLNRRHLTDQQRAVSAAKAKVRFEAEALERRNANLLQNKGSTDGLNSAHRSEGRSADRAAAMLGVSVDATKKASKMLKGAAPELVAEVEQGNVSLDAAAWVSTLPREEQQAHVDNGTVQAVASEMRKTKAAAKETSQKEPDATEQPTTPAEDTDKPVPAADTGSVDTSPSQAVSPVKITPAEAFNTLIMHVRSKGAAFARSIIERIATEAALDLWVSTNEPSDDLSALDSLVAERLSALADTDIDEARAWADQHTERLGDLLLAAAPEQGDEEEAIYDE